MNEFLVKIAPPVCQHKEPLPEGLLYGDLDISEFAFPDNAELFLLQYFVCGREISYYATDLVNVLIDLLIDFRAARDDGSHVIHFQEYPVAEVLVNSGVAFFGQISPREALGCVRYTNYLESVETAAASVWAQLLKDRRRS